MKNVYACTRKYLARRTLLKGAGVGMALPCLDAMTPAFAHSETDLSCAAAFCGDQCRFGVYAGRVFSE